MAQSTALNRLRRRVERWSDVLLGGLLQGGDVLRFAVEPERAIDFAADLAARRGEPGGQQAWRLTLVSLRNAFHAGLSPIVTNGEANARIASADSGMFPRRTVRLDRPVQVAVDDAAVGHGQSTPRGWSAELLEPAASSVPKRLPSPGVAASDRVTAARSSGSMPGLLATVLSAESLRAGQPLLPRCSRLCTLWPPIVGRSRAALRHVPLLRGADRSAIPSFASEAEFYANRTPGMSTRSRLAAAGGKRDRARPRRGPRGPACRASRCTPRSRNGSGRRPTKKSSRRQGRASFARRSISPLRKAAASKSPATTATSCTSTAARSAPARIGKCSTSTTSRSIWSQAPIPWPSKAVNTKQGSAGLVARVVIKQQGNTHVEYSTDATWKTTLKEFPQWEKAAVRRYAHGWPPAASAPLGATLPWGNEVTWPAPKTASRSRPSSTSNGSSIPRKPAR